MKCPDCEGEGFKEYDAGLVQIWCKTCESTGKVDCELTKEEFEKAYAFRSDMTVDQVTELGLVAAPCDCGEDDCKGWAMQRVEAVVPNVPEQVHPQTGSRPDNSEEGEKVGGFIGDEKKPDQVGNDVKGTTVVIGNVDLCQSCALNYPMCDSPDVEYGEDPERADKVVKCVIYSPESQLKLSDEGKIAEAAANEEHKRATRVLKPNEYRCGKCSKPGKTVIHMVKKDGKGVGTKHLEFKI